APILWFALEFKVGRCCSDPRAERIGHRLRIADRIGICDLSGRDGLWIADHIGIYDLSGWDRLGVGEGSIDLLAELVDDPGRRGLGCADAIRLLIVARTSCTHDDSRGNCNGTHHRCSPGHRIGLALYLDYGAIGSNVQTRSKKPGNVPNLLHRPARPAAGNG